MNARINTVTRYFKLDYFPNDKKRNTSDKFTFARDNGNHRTYNYTPARAARIHRAMWNNGGTCIDDGQFRSFETWNWPMIS